jgi:putative transposase
VLDRDWNAAINILKLALSTTGHVGTWVVDRCWCPEVSSGQESAVEDPNASGDLASTLAGAILSGQAGSRNEESPPA